MPYTVYATDAADTVKWSGRDISLEVTANRVLLRSNVGFGPYYLSTGPAYSESHILTDNSFTEGDVKSLTWMVGVRWNDGTFGAPASGPVLRADLSAGRSEVRKTAGMEIHEGGRFFLGYSQSLGAGLRLGRNSDGWLMLRYEHVATLSTLGLHARDMVFFVGAW